MLLRRASVVALLLGFAWMAVSCGGAAPAPTEGPLTLTVIAGVPIPEEGPPTEAGFAFEGEDVVSPGPTITVRAGQPVTITFQNMEDFVREPHNFVIVAEKDKSAEPLWGAETERLRLGDQQTITFTSGTPGTYFYICSLSDHLRRGMWGTFIVED